MAKQLNVDLRFRADTSQAQQQIQQLQHSLTQIASAGTVGIGGEKITAEMKQASAAAKELQLHLSKAMNTQTGTLDLNKLNNSLLGAKTNLQSLSTSLLQIGPNGTTAFTQLATAVSQADRPVLALNSKLTQLWTVMKNTMRWQLSSSMLHGFISGISNAYKYAQDLNESLNNIRIVTGYSAEYMENFALQANKAAKALSTTTNEYAKASLIYFQQGLNAEEVNKRADITIKMANVSRQSAEIVSDQLTAVWNNFYDGSKSLEYYADVMTALGAKTASSSDEIAGGLEKFAAVGETIGLSYEYAASALATITANTRQSEEVVGTALKTIFARMQGLKLGETLDDGVELNKYSQALATIGVDIFDANRNLKDMDNILDETAAKWDTLTKAQQTATAQTVAGIRQYNQFIALMDNWNDGTSDSMVANLETSYGATGALEEQADIYADSWEAASKRVKTSAEAIYNALLDDDFFIGMNNMFSGLLDGINGFIDEIGGLKTVMIGAFALITSHLANKLQPMINNTIANFQVLFTGASKQAINLGNSMQQAIEKAQSNTKINLSLGEEQQLKNANALILAKNKLTAVNKDLSAEERYLAETELQLIQMEQERAVSLAQTKEKSIEKTNQLKEELATEEKLLQMRQSSTGGIDRIYQGYQRDFSNAILAGDNERMDQAGIHLDNMEAHYTKVKQAAQDTANVIRTEFVASLEQTNYTIPTTTQLFQSQISGLEQIQANLIDTAQNSKLTAQEQIEAFQSARTGIEMYAQTLPKTIMEQEKVQQAYRAMMTEAHNPGELVKGLEIFIQSLEKAGISAKDLKNIMTEFGQGGLADKIIASYKEQKKATDDLSASEERLKQAFANFNPVHKSTGIEQITALGSALSSTAMMAMSLKSIFSSWANEDMSFGEKLTSSLMSFGMLIPSVTGVINGFGKAIDLVNIKQGMHAATTLEEMTATVALTSAESAEQLVQKTGMSLDQAEIAMDKIQLLNKLTSLATHDRILGQKAKELVATKLNIEADKVDILMSKLKEGASIKEALAAAGATKGLQLNTKALWANVAATWAKLWPLLAIVGAIGLLVVGLKVADAAYNADAEAAKKAAEAAKEAEEQYKSAQEAYSTFIDNTSKYDEATKGLATLKKGTAEYTEQLLKANEAALELVNSLELSAGVDYTVGADGLIQIKKEALERGRIEKLQAQQSAQQHATIMKQEAKTAQLRKKQTDFNREYAKGSGWSQEQTAGVISTGAGIASGAAIGATLGSIIPVLGTGIGAAIGAGLGGLIGLLSNEFDGRSTKEEDKALELLKEEYKREGASAITKDGIRATLEGEVSENLIQSLQKNAEETQEMIKQLANNDTAIRANTKAILGQKTGVDNDPALEIGAKAYEDAYNATKQRLKDEGFGKSGVAQWDAVNGKATEYSNQFLDAAKNLGLEQYKDYQLIDTYGDDNNRRFVYSDAAGNKFEVALETMINTIAENEGTKAGTTATEAAEENYTNYTDYFKKYKAVKGNNGQYYDTKEGDSDIIAAMYKGKEGLATLSKEQIERFQYMSNTGMINKAVADDLGKAWAAKGQNYGDIFNYSTGKDVTAVDELLTAVRNIKTNGGDLFNDLTDSQKATYQQITGSRYGDNPYLDSDIENVIKEYIGKEKNIGLLEEAKQKDGNLGMLNESYQQLLDRVESGKSAEEYINSIGGINSEAIENDVAGLGMMNNYLDGQKAQEQIDQIKEFYNQLNDEDKLLFAQTADFKIATNKEMMQEFLDQEKEKKAMSEGRAQAEAEGFDPDVLETQARQIMKNTEGMEDNAEAAVEMALANQRLNKGVDKLTDGWKDWNKALRASDKTTQDYAEALENTKDSLREMFGLTKEDIIPDSFFEDTKNLDLIDQVANGSEEALAQLHFNLTKAQIESQAFTADIAQNMRDAFQLPEDTDYEATFENMKKSAVSALEGIKNAAAGIDIGKELSISNEDQAKFAQDINQLALAAGWSAEQMQSALSSVGVTAEMDFIEGEPVSKMIPTIEITRSKTVDNPDGSQTWRETSKTVDYVSHKEPTMVPQIKMQDPKNPSKQNKPIFKKTSMGNIAPSVTSGGKSSGGGNKSSKPKKIKPTELKEKNDEVERYHEINEELEDLQNNLDEISNLKDEAWGANKLAAMDKEKKKLQELATSHKKYQAEIAKNLNDDRWEAESKYGAQIDPTTGRITNYEELQEQWMNEWNTKSAELDTLEQEYENKIATASEEEKEKLEEEKETNVTEKREELDKEYEARRKAIEQYEDTLNLSEEAQQQLDDYFRQMRQLNYEKLEYKIELKLELNENEIQDIEHKMERLGENNIYRSVERIGGIWNKANYYQEMGKAEMEGIEEAERLYRLYLSGDKENGISEEDYITRLKEGKENLQDIEMSVRAGIEAIADELENTFDLADERLDENYTKFDQLIETMEHYKNVVSLTEGDAAYNDFNKILKASQQVLKDRIEADKAEVAMWSSSKADLEAKIATLPEGSAARLEAEESLKYVMEKEAEAKSQLMADIEQLGEYAREIFENSIEQATIDFEEAMFGTSLESVIESIEMVRARQEELLTTTNKIYETNKLIRNVEKDIEATTNNRAKQAFAEFQNKVKQKQEQNQLTQFELDLLTAEYEMTKAQIALEEAREAKDTVRLTRDSEGNYGYVYTANEDKVADAEQALDDATNNYYNTALDGAQKYQDQIYQHIQEWEEKVKEVYLDQTLSEEEKNAKIKEINDTYNTLITQDKELFYIAKAAMEESSYQHQIDYDELSIKSAEKWFTTSDGYLTDLKEAQNLYDLNTKDVRDHTVNNFGDMETAIGNTTTKSNDLKTSSENLANSFNNILLGAIGDATLGWQNYLNVLEKVVTMTDQAMYKNSTKNDYAQQIIDEYAKGDEADQKIINALVKQRVEKLNGIDLTDYQAILNRDDLSDAQRKTYELLRNEKIKMLQNTDYTAMLKEYLTTGGGKITDQRAKDILAMRDLKIKHFNLSDAISNEELIEQIKAGQFDTGGYTGAWGPEGKLAVLHEKELVLNAQDTENLLAGTMILREISQMLDRNALLASLGMADFEALKLSETADQVLQQDVTIHAEFPNVTDHNEIELAIDNLINAASQHAYKV